MHEWDAADKGGGESHLSFDFQNLMSLHWARADICLKLEENPSKHSWDVLVWRTAQTDRQTDAQTDAQTAGKHKASGPGDRSSGEVGLWNSKRFSKWEQK